MTRSLLCALQQEASAALPRSPVLLLAAGAALAIGNSAVALARPIAPTPGPAACQSLVDVTLLGTTVTLAQLVPADAASFECGPPTKP